MRKSLYPETRAGQMDSQSGSVLIWILALSIGLVPCFAMGKLPGRSPLILEAERCRVGIAEDVFVVKHRPYAEGCGSVMKGIYARLVHCNCEVWIRMNLTSPDNALTFVRRAHFWPLTNPREFCVGVRPIVESGRPPNILNNEFYRGAGISYEVMSYIKFIVNDPCPQVVSRCHNTGVQSSFALASARLQSVLSGICNSLVLSDHPLRGFSDVVGGGSHVGGGVSLIASRDSQSMGIDSTLMHLPELVFQNPYREATGEGQNACKESHPHGRGSRPSGGLIGGCLILLLGGALVKLAFYIADEPNPPTVTRVLYWSVGIVAFALICQGLYLIFLLL